MRGQWKYPELWDSVQVALCPSQGCTWDRLRDYSGKQNHGTLTNMDPGTDWSPSQGQLALDFDGTDDYVTCGSIGIPTGSAPRTVTGWIYKTDNTTHGPLVHYGALASRQRFLFNVMGAGGYSGIPNQRLSAEFNGNTVYSADSVTLGQWVFVAATAGGLVSATNLYIDGMKSTVATTGVDGTLATASSSISLGAFFPLESVYGKMLLDDIRIYDRVLSDNAIRLLATRRGIAYELAPRRRHSASALFNPAWAMRRSTLIGGGLR